MEYGLWFHFKFYYHSLLKCSSRKKKNASKAKKGALAKRIKKSKTGPGKGMVWGDIFFPLVRSQRLFGV